MRDTLRHAEGGVQMRLAAAILVVLLAFVIFLVIRDGNSAPFHESSNGKATSTPSVGTPNPSKPYQSDDEKIHALSAEARNCLGMYLKYGSEKVSNLTMGQIRQIQGCQDRGLYHDLN